MRPFARIAWLVWLTVVPQAAADEAVPLWVPAQVSDASDRAYEPTAIQLIDHAERSIVLSMYIIQETHDDRHPVNRLLSDVVEAARRGVRVELYLNTKFDGATLELTTPWLTRMKAAGGQVVPLPGSQRLHDKLLIVDERYVLEGSANWSAQALKQNWESNTLVDSPVLAARKLARVRQFVDLQQQDADARRPEAPLPETVAIPVAWLSRGGALPRLVAASDERGADLLLLLARLRAWRGAEEFAVPLEPMAFDLGLPGAWAATARRRQIIKALRRLRAHTKAFEIRFTRSRDAWVRFTSIDGPSLPVPTARLQPVRLAQASAAATYLELLSRLDPETTVLRLRDLRARTGLSQGVLRRALRERAERLPPAML